MNLDIYKGKRILVTGGTGSFGQNYVRYLLERTKAATIIIFSRDEFKQFHMQRELRDSRLRFFIGDVRDLSRLQRALHGVDIVIHAAALKQIPILEYNPFEAVKTNIIGSQNVIEAAIDQHVSRVLLISTDKAAQPINLYGSTKLCAEKLFINGNSYTDGKTMLAAVRYGNVLGSRGSIVETLMRKRDGEEVHITDERMTRFWITYEEAFKLVSFALTTMVGGEIFVPRIPSMKIVDLFYALVPNARRKIIGIRPGEKLHEMLLTPLEAKHTIALEDYYVILPEDQGLLDGDRYMKYVKSGSEVAEDFQYESHTNDRWITIEELQAMILKDKNDTLRTSDN